MDDLIYVIALIAWVAFSFYRKSQKKSAAARDARPYQQPSAGGRTMPTLEEILLGKEPDPEPEPEPVNLPGWNEGTAPVLRETAFEKEYNLRGITSVEELDKPMSVKNTKPVDIQEDEIILKEIELQERVARIDLRQAVIYSEILNRPYV